MHLRSCIRFHGTCASRMVTYSFLAMCICMHAFCSILRASSSIRFFPFVSVCMQSWPCIRFCPPASVRMHFVLFRRLVQNLGHFLVELQSRHVLVLGRTVLGNELRQRPDIGVAARLEKEDARVAIRQPACRLVAHGVRERDLVHAGANVVVGQARARVADVDDQLRGLARGRRQHGRKGAWGAAVLELEAADGVLEEEGDDAEVGVRPRALNLALEQRLDGHRRVVVEAQLASGARASLHEGARGQLQAHLERRHDLQADGLTHGEIRLHERAELGHVLVGPQIGVFGVVSGAAVKVLLLVAQIVARAAV
jgi:hypothetical protein